MAHELEIIGGKASAAFVVTGTDGRTEPWHRLGTYVKQAMTAEEALKLANLDWEVVTEPIFTATGNQVPGRNAVIRRNGTEEVFGVVGDRWQPVQNATAFSFCDEVVRAAGDAHYECAGMLRPNADAIGAQTFMLLRRPGLFLDPDGSNDEIARYLLCSNGFDGRKAFTLKATNVRVVCKNTQEMALSGAGSTWKVSHTKSVEGRIAQAQLALGLFSQYDDMVLEAMTTMARKCITLKEYNRMMRAVFPAPALDAAPSVKARYDEQRAMRDAIYVGDTNANILGTAWGAYNTVTEYLDWARPTRSAATQHATQTLISPVILRTKQHAFDHALALAS